MIIRTCKKADPDRSETSCRDSLSTTNRFSTKLLNSTFPQIKTAYRGPEQRIKTIFKSHPSIPVPITATKMATGAANAARLTSSLLDQVASEHKVENGREKGMGVRDVCSRVIILL
jgi:hypothetical protein